VPRIAVVDDDTVLLELLQELFADKGWGLLPCAQGSAAFVLLTQEYPDAILLDLLLETPIGGWQILQRLKQDPLTRSIPVIVWSAAAHLHDKQSWLAEQGIPVLDKPFEIDELYQTVEAALTGKVTNLQLP
jgi:CheY-like chemotaxis protein